MTSKNIKVYACGQRVMVGNKGEKDIKAEITAVTLRPNYILYEITWWKEQTKNSIWMNESEFIINKNSKNVDIGFKQA